MKPRLLVAEPDPTLAVIFPRFLRRHGYEVDVASEGLECLEQMRRAAPQVLVLSAELLWGGCDGVLARIRENVDVPWVPVVLISTAAYTQHDIQLMMPPIVQSLLKPFSLTSLLHAIRSAASCREGEIRKRLDASAPRDGFATSTNGASAVNQLSPKDVS